MQRLFVLLFVLVATGQLAIGDESTDKRSQSKQQHADDADKRVQAKQHYMDGDRAFRLGDFATAAKEFKMSFSLSGEPLLLYNLGQTYRQLGDVKQSLFFYEQCVASSPPGAAREICVQRVVDLRAALQTQQRAQEAPPTGTAAPTSTLSVPPNGAATTQSVPALAMNPSHDIQADEQRPVYKKWWLWTIVGVGAAAIAVGVGVGVSENNGGHSLPLFKPVSF